MMMNAIFKLIEMVIGFSSGIVIGAGFVAILTVLGITPRLIQLSRSHQLIHFLSATMVFGVLSGTYLSFTSQVSNYPRQILIIWGILHGLFNGMLAAALVEIINVFPLLTRRVRVEYYMLYLLTALVFGKIVGSLLQWLFVSK